MQFRTSWGRIWTRRSRACPRATARATRRAIRRSATRSTSSGGTTPTTMPRGSATSREVVARPLVTYALVALNIAAFLLVEGAGAPRALARRVRLRPDPGRAHRRAAAGHTLSHGRRSRVSHRSGPAARQRADLDVSAWLVDAPARQHVVPVAVRQQHRGLDGPRALRGVLSRVRRRGGAGAGRRQSALGGADGRRLGRDQRRHGRLPRALPARARLHAAAHRLLHRRVAGVDDAALLAGPAVRQRAPRFGHGRDRWRRVLGARRRLRDRHGAGEALRPSRRRPRAPRGRLAAAPGQWPLVAEKNSNSKRLTSGAFSYADQWPARGIRCTSIEDAASRISPISSCAGRNAESSRSPQSSRR